MDINMNQQVLSIERMRHLIKLGVDTSSASMIWRLLPECFRIPEDHYVAVKESSEKKDDENMPTFTLQDMLNIMPKELKMKVESYRTPVDCLLMIDVANNCVYYECFVWQQYDRAKYFDGVNLISSAYKMLCWLAENGYLNKK